MDNPNPHDLKLDIVLVFTHLPWEIWIKRNRAHLIELWNHEPKFYLMRNMGEIERTISKLKLPKSIGILADQSLQPQLDILILTELAEAGQKKIVILDDQILA